MFCCAIRSSRCVFRGNAKKNSFPGRFRDDNRDGGVKNRVKRMQIKTVYDDDGKNDKKKNNNNNNNGRLHE